MNWLETNRRLLCIFLSEEAHGPSGFIEVDDIIEILGSWKMRPEEIKEALRGHLTPDGEHGDNNCSVVFDSTDNHIICQQSATNYYIPLSATTLGSWSRG